MLAASLISASGVFHKAGAPTGALNPATEHTLSMSDDLADLDPSPSQGESTFTDKD